MKKQVIALAALVLGGSTALAAGGSGSSMGSFGSLADSVAKSEAGSKMLITGSGNSIKSQQELYNDINREQTAQMRKKNVLGMAGGSLSAVGGFSVVAVEKVSAGAVSVVKVVLEGAVSTAKYTLQVSTNVGNSVATSVDKSAADSSAASKEVGGAALSVLKAGGHIVLAIFKSGTVLIAAPFEAATMGMQGNGKGSSGHLVGSLSKSNDAFYSEAVQGFRK